LISLADIRGGKIETHCKRRFPLCFLQKNGDNQ
jgi:hypothetical protein